jgi:hypothetical protein
LYSAYKQNPLKQFFYTLCGKENRVFLPQKLYRFNAPFLYTEFSGGNILFFSPDIGKNIQFNGFFLTVSPGRAFYARESRKKRPDTVGQPPSAANCASHMPSLKAQEPGESEPETPALQCGNRLANTLTTLCET